MAPRNGLSYQERVNQFNCEDCQRNLDDLGKARYVAGLHGDWETADRIESLITRLKRRGHAFPAMPPNMLPD